MSVLNYKNKTLFIHVPKTAGTSMEAAPFIGLHGHIPLIQYEMTLDRGSTDLSTNDFFKFAFVRNPYDRFVSSFFHCKRYKFIKPYTKLKDVADLLPKEANLDFTAIRKKGMQGTFGFTPDNPLFHPQLKDLFYPQAYYLMNSEGKCGTDYLGRFEFLKDDWKELCKRLKRRHFKLPHKKRTKHKPYEEYYTKAIRKKVKSFYKTDFDLFNY